MNEVYINWYLVLLFAVLHSFLLNYSYRIPRCLIEIGFSSPLSSGNDAITVHIWQLAAVRHY